MNLFSRLLAIVNPWRQPPQPITISERTLVAVAFAANYWASQLSGEVEQRSRELFREALVAQAHQFIFLQNETEPTREQAEQCVLEINYYPTGLLYNALQVAGLDGKHLSFVGHTAMEIERGIVKLRVPGVGWHQVYP
jgi:hypothetical protein